MSRLLICIPFVFVTFTIMYVMYNMYTICITYMIVAANVSVVLVVVKLSYVCASRIKSECDISGSKVRVECGVSGSKVELYIRLILRVECDMSGSKVEIYMRFFIDVLQSSSLHCELVRP